MKPARAGAIVGGLVVLAMVGVATLMLIPRAGTEPDPAAGRSRVAAVGTGLTLDGRPWWPTGFNAYQLATDWSLNAGCGAEVDLDAYFGALPARSLTRFSLFAPFTERKDDGTIDYSAVDRVFEAAARHDQLVLPVLAAGDGACDGEHFRDADWYRSGWHDQRATAHGSYADWVRAAVDRWRHAPALAGWTAIGEAEAGSCLPGKSATVDCTEPANRRCPAGATATLRRFFDDAGALIRRLDPVHPIFAGLLGGGQCGIAGDGFARLAASPGIDVLEYHEYDLEPAHPERPAGLGLAAHPSPAEPRPDRPVPSDTLQARTAVAARLGKPLLLAEIGLKSGSCRSAAQRGELLRAAVGRAREFGVAGALVWAYVPDPRPHECTYDIGPGDPLWPSIR